MTADFDKRVTRREKEFRAWCRRENIDVTPGGEVSEKTAGILIGYQGRDTLAVQRMEGRLPPELRVRCLGRGYLYDVYSCAVFVEAGYDAWFDANVSRDATQQSKTVRTVDAVSPGFHPVIPV
jgi:hypothetical protein